jgi:hypothetical protein
MGTLRLLAIATVFQAGCLGSYSAPNGPSGGGGVPGGGTGSGGGGGGTVTDPGPPGVPTFYEHALPIFQKSCLGCHFESGGTAPFFDTAAKAKAAATAIMTAVMTRSMPPFPPEAGCSSYVGERRLSATEQQTLVMWAMSGAHAGDPAKASSITPTPPDKMTGTADKRLQAGPFTPTFPGSAGASDLYWCFAFDTGLTTSRDLVAIQTNPGTIAQVHHVLIFRDAGGQRSANAPAGGYECNGAPGEMLAGWVPGSGPLKLPPGVGMTLDPADRLLIQVHYHKDAVKPPEPDSTSIDLYFAQAPTPEHAYVVWSGTPLFSIPAGAKNYPVKSTCTVNGSWKVLGIAPHMHQRATQFKSDLTVAGAAQCLMNIPRWDFGWQGGYFLNTPINLSQGDKILTTCTYDNPTGTSIKFGEATTQEMCFGFLYVVAPTRPRFNGLVNLFGGPDAESICAN